MKQKIIKPFNFFTYNKALTIKPQHHTMRNIDIQIYINVELILSMYFKDSNLIFKKTIQAINSNIMALMSSSLLFYT
jgi:hypothetical protein